MNSAKSETVVNSFEKGFGNIRKKPGVVAHSYNPCTQLRQEGQEFKSSLGCINLVSEIKIDSQGLKLLFPHTFHR